MSKERESEISGEKVFLKRASRVRCYLTESVAESDGGENVC